MKDYPRQPVGRDELKRFIARLNQEKNNFYGKRCKLSIHMNTEGVDSTVPRRFIAGELRLFPVQE